MEILQFVKRENNNYFRFLILDNGDNKLYIIDIIYYDLMDKKEFCGDHFKLKKRLSEPHQQEGFDKCARLDLGILRETLPQFVKGKNNIIINQNNRLNRLVVNNIYRLLDVV